MYPILLPLLFFVLIFYFLLQRRPETDLRTLFLSSAVVWGIIITAITELLTLQRALTLATLVVSWAVVTLGVALIAARHASLSHTRPGSMFKPPPLLALAVSLPIVAILLVTAFIATVGWPNQWDTMVYHLSRVDHWVQNRSVVFYPTHIVRQLFSPPWAEYAILHLTVLGGDERFANLPQWFSMLGSLIGVSLIAKHMGVSPLGQLFSALFCATIPMGILQASGTQNDYVTAFWLVCLTDALIMLQRQQASDAHALRAGASLGLALLTKGTAYIFVGPSLLALLLPGLMFHFTRAARPAALIIVVVLALNTPHYVRNLDTFGFFLGPRNLGSATEVNDNLANETFSPPILISNLVRNVAIHVGTPLPTFNTLIEKVIEKWHTWLGSDVNDPRSTRLYPEDRFKIVGTSSDPDRTGNPIHLLLIISVTVTVTLSREVRRYGILWPYVLALGGAFVLFGSLLKWQPWHSRLHLPLFVLWSPAVGLIYELREKLLIVAALVMTLCAWPPLVHSYLHPLLGERSVLRTSRMDQYFPFRPTLKADYIGAAEFLHSRGCAEVGLLLRWDDLEHPLWALLPEVWAGRGRLEHVGVTNSSARLESRLRPFAPCAVVAVSNATCERLEVGGRSYRLAWSSNQMKVFLVDATAQRQLANTLSVPVSDAQRPLDRGSNSFFANSCCRAEATAR